MTTINPTDFNFQVRKDFKFKGCKGGYEATVTIAIYLVDGSVPEIIRSTDKFMNEALVPGWGYRDPRTDNMVFRQVVLLGETAEEIKQLADEREDELIDQLKAIYRRNVAAMGSCPPDTITEYSWT